MRFTLTDESLDADRERVLIDGASLNRFLRNPVMLWRHYGEPIGRWKDVRIEEDPKRITAEAEFYEKDSFAKRIADMVRAGFLKACSIGFRPLERSTEPAVMLPGQSRSTITKFELIEASIVPIPSNSNALIEALEKEFGKKESFSTELSFGVDKIQKLITIKPQLKMELKEITKALGLPESASETEITQAVARVQKEKVDMQASALEVVIALGKSKGVIHAENEAEFKHLASVDLEATKRLIEKMVAPQTITTAQVGDRVLLVDKLKERQKATQVAQTTDEVSALKSWRDYEKNDPKGLKKMLEQDPEKAQALADKYLTDALGL